MHRNHAVSVRVWKLSEVLRMKHGLCSFVSKLYISFAQSNLFLQFCGCILDWKLNAVSSLKRHTYMNRLGEANYKFACTKVVKTQINLASYPVPFVCSGCADCRHLIALQWMWIYLKSFVVRPPAKRRMIIKSTFYVYDAKIFYPLMEWCLPLHNKRPEHPASKKPSQRLSYNLGVFFYVYFVTERICCRRCPIKFETESFIKLAAFMDEPAFLQPAQYNVFSFFNWSWWPMSFKRTKTMSWY